MAIALGREIRQYQNLERHDDIRLEDSWIEFGKKDETNFIIYKLKFRDSEDDEWEDVYKAVRFLRLMGVPREIREEETHMDIITDILGGLWASDVDFLHVIAKVKEPTEKVLFLYGVQGVAHDIEDAKDIAREGYAALRGALRGSVSQIRVEQLSLEDAETLREKMYDMRYVQMIRGLPKARRAAAGSSQSSIVGHLSVTDAEQQIEELVRGMDDEFVMITVASPVPYPSLNDWLHNHAKEQSIWESEKEGSKAISAGIAMPMVLAGSLGTGENTGTSLTEGTSDTIGTSLTETFGTSEGVGFSENVSESIGESHGVSESVGTSVGTTIGESETHSRSWGTSETYTTGTSVSHSEGATETHSEGSSTTLSTGTSENWGQSEGYGTSSGTSDGTSYSEGINKGTSSSQGTSDSHTVGGSRTHSEGTSTQHSTSSGYSRSLSESESFSESSTISGSGSEGRSIGFSSERSASNSTGFTLLGANADGSWSAGGGTTDSLTNSLGSGWSIGGSHSAGWSESLSANMGRSETVGHTQGTSVGETWGHSTGTTNTQGYSEGMSQSMGRTTGTTTGESWNTGSSYSRGISDSRSEGTSLGFSRGVSTGTSTGTSESFSRGTSYGESISRGTSRSESVTESVGRSTSHSTSSTRTTGESRSYSQSTTDSEARGYSQNKGESTSRGYSQGLSQNRGMSASMAMGPSLSASKSVQWKRMDIESLVEIMELQRMRLQEMVRSGGWFVDVYLLTNTIEGKEQAAILSRAAFWSNESVPQPIQIVEPSTDWAEHLMLHASCFSACSSKEDTPSIMDTYKYSTILLPSELAAYTHLPRGEFGGVVTVAERVPLFAVPETKGNIFMGHVISPETGDLTNVPYNFNEETLMHTLIAGASGTGKTVSAIRYVDSILKTVDVGAVILDWKMDWRALLQYIPKERARFYGLDSFSHKPIKMNLLEPPEYISPTTWRDKIIESMCVAFGLGSKQYGILYKHLTELFYENDIIRFVNHQRDGSMRVIPKNYQDSPETGYRSIKIPENGYPDVHPNWRDNIRNVTLATLYLRLREVREIGLDRNSRGLADTYDSLLTRLEYYVSGELRRLYASSDEDNIRISDFVHGKMVTVLEGGNLDSLNKIFVINVFMQGLFLYSKEKFRKNGNKVDNEVLIVLEEAHNVIPGDSRGNDMPLPISESIWEIAFNESRGYGMYLTAIVQVPSGIPTNITANCSNLIVHRLGNSDDTEVVTTLLVRDGVRDHRDIPRFLTRLPVGIAVTKQSRVRNLWEMEPAVVGVSYLAVDTPSDEVLDTFLLGD